MSTIRVDLLWVWIAYFLLMGIRCWSTSLYAMTNEDLRFYHQETRRYFALACAVYVAWLWVSGAGEVSDDA